MRVLVVGQTPPPITGQAAMIAQIVASEFPDIALRHVPMRFSAEVDEIGRFRWRKLFELVRVIAHIAFERLRWRADVLFYPPAGGSGIPVARDVAILLATRWMFRFTVFHFHARGAGAIYEKAPVMLRPLFRLAYFGADLAIRPAQSGDDAARLRAKRSVVIANAVADDRRTTAFEPRPAGRVTILYLSQVSPEKGILTLLDAMRLVASARPDSAVLNIVGPFASAAFRSDLEERIEALGLWSAVSVSGELAGEAKSRAYAAADIFCFPSVHPTETFGLVAVEAMSFALPVIAADWGGIRDIVEDGATGILFPPGDHLRLAEALERLIGEPGLRAAMGRRGRDKYLTEYTVDRFRERLGAALRSIHAAKTPERPEQSRRAELLAGQSKCASD